MGVNQFVAWRRSPARPLRGGTPPNGNRPVIGILETQEIMMCATLVWVMALR
jgi:hypothetical protein